MLVLSRRPGEEVVIAGCIRVTILAAKEGQVRIGIEAPPSVLVDRTEVHDRRARSARLDGPLVGDLAYRPVGLKGMGS